MPTVITRYFMLALALLLSACSAPAANGQNPPTGQPGADTPGQAAANSTGKSAKADPVGSALDKIPAVEKISFGNHPRVALSPAEAQALRAVADFEKQKAAAVKVADRLLENPPELPDGFGSWTFYYANPKTGNDLVPITPLAHKDPKTNEIFTDERTVAAYRGRMHYALDKAAENLAWAYFYTGEEKYAQGVVRILDFLAEAYPNYPKRLDRWGRTGWLAPLGGRRYVQALDEAVSVIQLARAYDLTISAQAWTPELRKKVEAQFFRGTAESLLWFRQPHNHQTWYNAGLVAIACVLGDAKLLHQVLTMDKGVVEQLDRNVGVDGLWAEGTMAYHNYALQALLKTVDITDRNGIDLSSLPKLRLMIQGPLFAAYPDGSFPAINDSDPSSTASMNYAFKWAFEKYKDPLFAQAFARGNETVLKQMLGENAQVQWPLQLPSADLPDAGLAILRVGKGPAANAVFVDYGKHGIAHGHYDKLNFTLFANSREWILDPGRLTYSHKEFTTWVKETIAHNTVVVDMKTQKASEGKLHWLIPTSDAAAPDGQWTGLSASADSAYPGVKLHRTMLLTPTFLLDVFNVDAGSSQRQVDYTFHTRSRSVTLSGGEAKQSPAPAPGPVGKDNGYQHLTDPVYYQPGSLTRWDFQQGQLKLAAWLLPNADAKTPEPETVVTCYGIGYNTSEKTPSILRRRKTSKTQFVTLFDITGTGTGVTGIKQFAPDSFEVTTEKQAWTIKLKNDGAEVQTRAR